MVEGLAEKLNTSDHDKRKKNLPDRVLEVYFLDLDIRFRGDLVDGDLVNIREETNGGKANIRLAMTSDDLLDMTEGRLKFAHAWATGRVRLDASIRDLLRLRGLM